VLAEVVVEVKVVLEVLEVEVVLEVLEVEVVLEMLEVEVVLEMLEAVAVATGDILDMMLTCNDLPLSSFCLF